MHRPLTGLAATLALAISPLAAVAQEKPTEEAKPAATEPAKTAPSAETGSSANTAARVTQGLKVKDSTGAEIGEVTAVRADGAKQVANIKMGSNTFAVDAAELDVKEGAAVINATEAQIKDLIAQATGDSGPPAPAAPAAAAPAN